MPISFTCPHCGRFTETSDEYAGQSGPCAGCGQIITIPSALGPAPLKPTMPQPHPLQQKNNTSLIVAIVLGVMCVCGGGGMIALLLPAVQSAREAARRMHCSKNLKQIALAMHNYHDLYNAFPAGFVADEDGTPLHSWRVALLPYLEQSALYEMYNYDEPWDSPNNQMVASNMPDVFRCPSAPNSGPGSNLTHYVVVLGASEPYKPPNSIFDANRWLSFAHIVDGTSNTLLVVEVKDPVPWTQPDTDLHADSMSYTINSGSESIGSFHPNGANVSMADGSTHFLPNSLDSQTLRLMVQPADGQPVRFDQY